MRTHLLIVVTSILAAACGDSGASDGGDTSSSDDGVELDPIPCEPTVSGCTNDSQCCPHPKIACGPSEPWPNRWVCDNPGGEGICINVGCQEGECFPGWVCADIDGIGYCIQACGDSTDCDSGGIVGNETGKTFCTGEAILDNEVVYYCQEPQP